MAKERKGKERRTDLSPGFVDLVFEPDDLVELADVGGDDEDVSIADDG